jgi:phosphoadenosine phosphosulfate reductase
MSKQPLSTALAAANQRLRSAAPQAILRWAVEQFHPRLTMATAFGAEGCCLIHLLAEIEPGVHIFNLETGYQFAQTLEVRGRIRER